MLHHATQSKGGDDDGAKRAWARAATQKVLDLMLVTERVRQEEQKRRVAAARASTQVTKTKQTAGSLLVFFVPNRNRTIARGFVHAPRYSFRTKGWTSVFLNAFVHGFRRLCCVF